MNGDRDVCVGGGMCALTAPEVFAQSEEDGLVQVIDPDPGESAEVRRAISLCPAGAISITEISEE
ncbi:ferredoxin [Actinomadura sp. DC4]|uniref:ferredoxin n=1 Tax=Actinomadura sp. DC4 TaxID=3055069 RepID=UPI00339DA1D5